MIFTDGAVGLARPPANATKGSDCRGPSPKNMFYGQGLQGAMNLRGAAPQYGKKKMLETLLNVLAGGHMLRQGHGVCT